MFFLRYYYSDECIRLFLSLYIPEPLKTNKRIFLLNFYSCKCGVGQIHEQVKLLTLEGGTRPMGGRAGDALLAGPDSLAAQGWSFHPRGGSAGRSGPRSPARSPGWWPPARTLSIRFSRPLTLHSSSCYVSASTRASEKPPFL